VDEDVNSLESAVTHFTEQAGSPPVSMSELVVAGQLPGFPVDPDGNPYELTLDGQVRVQKPDDFPFITKGIPAGYKPPPPKFHTQN